MKKTIVIIFALILVIVFLFFFGTQIYLYLRLLTGNDLVVTVKADSDRFTLAHGENALVQFTVSETANPFCTVACTTALFDVSRGTLIGNQTREGKVPDTYTQEYVLTAPSSGVGQALYNFEIQCHARKTGLCRTDEELRYRNVLLVVNYTYTSAEVVEREAIKKTISDAQGAVTNARMQIERLSSGVLQLPTFIRYAELGQSLERARNDSARLNETLTGAHLLWEQGKEQEAQSVMNGARLALTTLAEETNALKTSIEANLALYTSSISRVTLVEQAFNSHNGTLVSEQTYANASAFVSHARAVITPVNSTTSIVPFSQAVAALENEWSTLDAAIRADAGTGTRVFDLVFPAPPAPVVLATSNVTHEPIVFRDPVPQCCVSNTCRACCVGDECRSLNETYPVVLVHGHTFNKAVSAETSLDTFGGFQHALEQDGFINGGILLLGARANEERGILGQARTPLTFRASYYFDIYHTKEDSSFVETKEDTLDSYAIRLHDTIDTIRYLTNKDKVVIVTHSMGGLVVERYMQVFGDDALDKVIFIGTPHKGISGEALRYCSLLGNSVECRDMDASSLFINKLLTGTKPSVPIYNLIGVGCAMSDQTGDGIVTNASASFEGAHTYYIQGTCTTFTFLHNDLVSVEKYPEVYRIVRNILKQ